MKIKKIVSIILLVIFVITLPLTLLVGNTSAQVLSEKNLPKILMESVFSNEALPQRIREAVWYQSWYGEGLDFGPRMMITGVSNPQITKLVGMIVQENARESLVHEIVQGIFDWVDNDMPYPDIVIETGGIVNNVNLNANEIGFWVHNSLKLPGCSAEVENNYVNEMWPEDPMEVISCIPSKSNHKIVGDHLGSFIIDTISTTPIPESIDVGESLAKNMDGSQAISTKEQISNIRTMTRVVWVIPVLTFGLALALVVRTKNDLLVWAGWPMMITGLIGSTIGRVVSNPAPFLEKVLMPPPEALPAPAAPIIAAIVSSLGNKVGRVLCWEMVIILVIGVVLIVFYYQAQLLDLIESICSCISNFLQINIEDEEKSYLK